MERERLLVREREDVIGVLDVEDFGDPQAPRLLPELGGREHRREPLLRSDRLHLVADDLLDLPVHAPPERRERPEARRHLPDETRAHEQLVADGVGVGRRVAQGRQVEL